MPVSGHSAKGMIQDTLIGPDWLTGGALGVEGSTLALIAVLTAGVALLAYAKNDRIGSLAWSTSRDFKRLPNATSSERAFSRLPTGAPFSLRSA